MAIPEQQQSNSLLTIYLILIKIHGCFDFSLLPILDTESTIMTKIIFPRKQKKQLNILNFIANIITRRRSMWQTKSNLLTLSHEFNLNFILWIKQKIIEILRWTEQSFQFSFNLPVTKRKVLIFGAAMWLLLLSCKLFPQIFQRCLQQDE